MTSVQANIKKPAPIQVPTLVVNWLKEEFVLDPKGIVQKAKLYEAYEDFCRHQSLRPRPPNTFGKILRQIFPHIQTKRLGSHRCQVTYYEGLAPKGGTVSLLIPKEEMLPEPQRPQPLPQSPQPPQSPQQLPHQQLQHLQLQQQLQQQQQILQQAIHLQQQHLQQLQQHHSTTQHQSTWLSSLTDPAPFSTLPPNMPHLHPQQPQLLPQPPQLFSQPWAQPLPPISPLHPLIPPSASMEDRHLPPPFPSSTSSPNGFHNSHNHNGHNNGFSTHTLSHALREIESYGGSTSDPMISDKDPKDTSWEQLGRFLKDNEADAMQEY